MAKLVIALVHVSLVARLTSAMAVARSSVLMSTPPSPHRRLIRCGAPRFTMRTSARSSAAHVADAPTDAPTVAPVGAEREVDKTLSQRMAPYLEMARIENVPAAYM